MASHIPTIFKKNLIAEFPLSTLKLALYDSVPPVLDAIEFYTTTNEVVGTGYVAGGKALTAVAARSGTTGMLDITDESWTGASFSTRWGIIYTTATIDGSPNSILFVLDWGGTKTVSGGTFTVDFPASGAATSTLQVN